MTELADEHADNRRRIRAGIRDDAPGHSLKLGADDARCCVVDHLPPARRPMVFHSILFADPDDGMTSGTATAPDFFVDLNLDQIVAAITAGKDEYNLAPFFSVPLHAVDPVTFRHEVMKDLENVRLFTDITAFARSMRRVRDHLAQLERRYNDHQKERWFLDAVNLYGDCVLRLLRALTDAELRSRGLLAFKDYLAHYAASDRFQALVDEAKRLEAEIGAIRYSVAITGPRVEIRRHAGQPDYSVEIKETFRRFQQGAVPVYDFKFSDSLEMNHIEGQILDGVAHLHSDTFAELARYRAGHKDFMDSTTATFDREIQFYISYLEYIAKLKNAGLGFCFPELSDWDKEICVDQSFDLALAGKLIGERAIPVANDFYLKNPERIIVVSGPNQGGKTTFARTFGQLHYLASLGCPIPGTTARLHLPDRIFTHFEREERMTNLRGKLEDDILRIRDILEGATPRSLVIINEIFASTALRDAIFLSEKIAAALIELDLVCVWVTFIEEVAAMSETAVSMVSTIVPDNPSQRTFKILRRRADGLAYAMSIAEKYRLSHDMILERLGS